MIWDAKNIAKLIALVAKGLSYSQIGKQLGMSKNAAIGKARRLRLSKSQALPVISMRRPTPRPKEGLKPKPEPEPKDHIGLVSMMNLRDGDCRYPIGEYKEMMFCGKPKHGNRVYCEKHASKCYQPIKSSGQRLSTQFQRR